MYFDCNTPVRSSTCGSASKMALTPIPKHVWKPRISGDIEELKPPKIRFKRKLEHAATSLRSPPTTTNAGTKVRETK